MGAGRALTVVLHVNPGDGTLPLRLRCRRGRAAVAQSQGQVAWILPRGAPWPPEEGAKRSLPTDSESVTRFLAAVGQCHVVLLSREGEASSGGVRRVEIEEVLKEGPKAPVVVFDLSFNEDMSDKEAASQAQQLQLCHSSNQRAMTPFKLVASGIKAMAGTRLESVLRAMNWATWGFEMEVVYLTSDASVDLDNVESEVVYIVGGCVDHKTKPNLSLKRAQELGFATARLPLALVVELRKPALSSVAVFQILQEQHRTGDWAAAIANCPAMHCAPIRKYVQWKPPWDQKFSSLMLHNIRPEGLFCPVPGVAAP